MAFGREVIFMAGVKLQTTLFTRLMLELVDKIVIRPGAPDKDALKAALTALKAGKRVHIFPEGGRSRTGTLLQGKPGVLLIARSSGVPIVPMGIMGTEKLMPIKENELDRETLHRAEVQIRVGPPFTLEGLPPAPDGHADPKQWLTDQLMLRIAALLDPPYWGVYADQMKTAGP
jgi:1-acyl-sn-glycerol-3-phosphate acyltransferase